MRRGTGAIEQVATDVTTAIGDIAVDAAAWLAALPAADAALGVAAVGLTVEYGTRSALSA